MKYQMHEQPDGLKIELSTSGHNREMEVLLDALEACGDGRCFCNTGEQQKLAGMEITQQGERLEVVMHAKAGTRFDWAKIGICLDVAARKAQRKD